MTEPTHTEHEDHGWTIRIAGHPPRSDSPEYVKTRALMNRIVKTIPNFYYGCGYQCGSARTGLPNESPNVDATPL